MQSYWWNQPGCNVAHSACRD